MGSYKNLCIALVALIVFAGCFKDDTKKQAQTPMTMPPQKVDVITAKKSDFPITFEYPALIVSDQDVIIVPKVSGTIIKQYFNAGDSVKAGDKLFLIDPEKYQANHNALEAIVGVNEAQLKNARTEFNRVKKLNDKNAISQKEYDAAVANLDIANANLASSKANLKSSKIDLGYTTVVAPFDGILGDNLADVGSYAAANATQLVRLTKINPVSAKFYIADIDALNRVSNIENSVWTQANSDATLKFGGKTYQGKIKFIDSVVDKSVGSIMAKAEFENKDKSLLPGAFANVIMDGFYQKDGFKIPQIALQQSIQHTYVLVVKDQKVTKKNVKISYQKEDYAIISDGLEDGDLIIINNFSKIGVGASVQIDKEIR